MSLQWYKSSFFNIAAKKQSYKNILYLLISFPLCLAYFVFAVTGISLGFGLAVIWIGFPILAAVLNIGEAIAGLEHRLISNLLHKERPPQEKRKPSGSSSKRLFPILSDKKAWKGILYILIKFPMGIIFFSLTAAFVTAPLAFLGTPIFLLIKQDINPAHSLFKIWLADYPVFIPFLMIFGVVLFFIALHICKGLVNLSAKLAGRLLPA